MTISVAQINVSSDTFGTWLQRQNQVANILSQNTVTIDSSTGGSISTGNGYVNGIFSSTTLATNTLRGGNVSTNGVLNVVSTVQQTLTPALGSTIGSNATFLTQTISASSNNLNMSVYAYRNATNTTWQSATVRYQFSVDSANYSYIEFNPVGDIGGIAFGATNAESFRVFGNNSVNFNYSITVNNNVTAQTVNTTGTVNVGTDMTVQGNVTINNTLTVNTSAIIGTVNATSLNISGTSNLVTLTSNSFTGNSATISNANITKLTVNSATFSTNTTANGVLTLNGLGLNQPTLIINDTYASSGLGAGIKFIGASGGLSVILTGPTSGSGIFALYDSTYSKVYWHIDSNGSTYQNNAVSTGYVQVGGGGGPIFTTGVGVPTQNNPKGSIYSRSDGAVGSTLYISQGGGVWNPVAGV